MNYSKKTLLTFGLGLGLVFTRNAVATTQSDHAAPVKDLIYSCSIDEPDGSNEQLQGTVKLHYAVDNFYQNSSTHSFTEIGTTRRGTRVGLRALLRRLPNRAAGICELSLQSQSTRGTLYSSIEGMGLGIPEVCDRFKIEASGTIVLNAADHDIYHGRGTQPAVTCYLIPRL